MSQNYPNPFNPSTTIEFQIPKVGDIELNIYNSIGEKVIVLYRGILQAGFYSLNWDGKNINGNDVPSGVYFYELVYNTEKLYKTTKKMLYLK